MEHIKTKAIRDFNRKDDMILEAISYFFFNTNIPHREHILKIFVDADHEIQRRTYDGDPLNSYEGLKIFVLHDYRHAKWKKGEPRHKFKEIFGYTENNKFQEFISSFTDYEHYEIEVYHLDDFMSDKGYQRGCYKSYNDSTGFIVDVTVQSDEKVAPPLQKTTQKRSKEMLDQ